VDTYEVGYRSALFGRRVQLTTAAFYNDYKNLQVAAHANAQHADISLAIVNAGSARTYGVEESLVWKASRAVTIGVNAGYLNAKYKTFAVSNSTVLLPFDASGETMPNSPKWQLSFTGDLDRPINDRFRLVGDVLVSHLSSIIFLQSALPGVLPEPSQPGYWLTNLRVGVRTMDDRYGFAIFANNLFDEGYVTYGSSNALGNELTWGNPRIVGAEVTAKW
jgi:iron complex outermembrane receptor protein